jgi:hypothetical protein
MPRTCTLCNHPRRDGIDRALLAGESFRHIAARFDTSTGALQRHKADHLRPSLLKAYQAKENARVEGFRARLETTWDAIQDAMDQAQRAVRIREDGTVEDRSVSVLTPLFNQAHRNLELLGRATGELSNDGAPATNVTLIRVLSVPRMPGVQTIHAIAEGAPPAAETTEAVRSLPAAEVDAPVESEVSDIPPRNRR